SARHGAARDTARGVRSGEDTGFSRRDGGARSDGAERGVTARLRFELTPGRDGAARRSPRARGGRPEGRSVNARLGAATHPCGPESRWRRTGALWAFEGY